MTKLGVYGPNGCVDVGFIQLDKHWTLIPTAELAALRKEHKLAAIAIQEAPCVNV